MASRSRQNASVKNALDAGGDQRSRWPSKFSCRKRATAACMPGRARRTTSRAVRISGSAAVTGRAPLGGEHPPLLRPAVHRWALEAALRVLVPAADHESDDRVRIGVHVPVGGERARGGGETPALAPAFLAPVRNLVHLPLHTLPPLL